MKDPLRVLIAAESQPKADRWVDLLRREGFAPEFERVERRKAMNQALETGNWDVILADYAVRRFHVLRLVRVYREQGGQIPCVVVSDELTEEAAVESIQAGAQDFVSGANVARLPQAVRALLENPARAVKAETAPAKRLDPEGLAGLANALEDFIYVFDRSGRILFCNEAALNRLGYAVASLASMRPREFFPESRRGEFEAAAGNAWRGEPAVTTAPLRTATGELLAAETRVVRNKLGDETVLVGFSRDLSEQARVEDVLGESERRYETVVASIADMVFTTDAQGRLTSLNPAFERILGWSHIEWIGRRLDPLVEPEDLDLLTERFRACLAGQAVAPFEARLRTKANEVAVLEFRLAALEAEGASTGMVGRAADVTARSRESEAMQQSHNELERRVQERNAQLLETEVRLQTLINCLPIDFWATDAWGRCTMQNAQSAAHWGQVLDRPLEELAEEPELAALWRDRFAALRAGETVRAEYPSQTSDGPRTYLSVIAPVNVGGSFEGALGVNVDITERKRMESHMRQLNQQLESRVEERTRELQDVNERLLAQIHEHERAKSALNQSEQRFHEAVTYARHVLYRYDAKRDRYDYIGGYAEDMLGIPLGQLMEMSQKDAVAQVHPADRDEVARALDEAIERGGGEPVSINLEYRRRTANGGYVWISDCLTFLCGAGGDLEAVVGSAYDVTERKEAEQSRRENEDRYRQLFEVSADAILVIDGETGRVEEANSQAQSLYGYTLEELQARTLRDLESPARQARDLLMHAGRNGEPFPVEVRKRRFEWGGRPVYVASVRDLTESIAAHTAVARQRAFLQETLDATPAAIYVTDEDGRIILVNRRLSQAFGVSSEQLVGQTALDILPDLEFSEIMYADDRRLLSGERNSVRRELGYASQHGATHWTYVVKQPLRHEGAKVSGVIAACVDITALKQTEEALQNNEELHRVTLSAISEAIVITDPAGRITYTSQSAERVFGLPWTDILQLDSIEDLLGDSFPPPAIERAQEVANVPCGIERGDGCARQLLVTVRRVALDDGALLYTCRDVSDVTQAEASLVRSEQQYRLLFNSMQNAFVLHEVICDSLGGPMGHRIVEVNAAFERLTGVKRAEALGQTFDAVLPDRDAVWTLTLGEVALTGTPVQFEYSVPGRDTTFEVIAFCPEPGRCATMFSDITQRSRAARERRKLATVVEQTAESIVITDTTGRIEYVNPGFERVTGYSRNEVAGKTPAVLQSGQHGRDFYQELWGAITSGRTWRGHFVNRRKDGALIREDATITPVRDDSGGIVSFVAVKRDVTSQLGLEAQLRQAQKMEAVGLLAGGVAHDFNNLLQGIQGYSHLALDGLEAADPRRSHLEQVVRTADRAAALTRQLLSFSRQQAMEPTYVNLDAAITDLAKMLRRLLGQNVELALDFSEEDKYVFADPGQFDQVLMNLCVNARDAMPGGGSLTLSTQLVQVDEAFRRTHPWATQDSYILTEVRDTGVGMAPEVMERIFEPFFSTKEENGTGLGLATTYGIVKGHDGMISVASAPGEGTSFLLYLPAVDAKELKRLDEEPPPDSGEGTGTILVAEDEEVVGRVVVDILNRAGYRAMLARDGQQALQLYEEHASAIDLVILDVVMPKVDGREVCLRLRAMQPDLPVLFSSGHSGAVLEPDFIRDTRAYTLPKPYSPTELLVTVRRALEEAARTN